VKDSLLFKIRSVLILVLMHLKLFEQKEPNYANFFNYYDMETVDGISYCKILRLIQ